ncbi:hypothetical protein LCGC14_1800160 [marine sediment metagenome]|uniref:Uncharacterized protein n=1 Tax=marine sediment metagenome TaxID=412755 RepID=A0A0F9GQ06_9ZZZZ
MYRYELMENYRKGTYLEIIFDGRTVRGFFRGWIDYEKNEKALIIDQTYLQHVNFVNKFYPSNREKAQLFTKDQTLTKEHYQNFSTSKILYADDIQNVKEIKSINCPICGKPMLRNESLTTPHVYWLYRCFGYLLQYLGCLSTIIKYMN